MDRGIVKPEMYRWACERAGFEAGALAERFPRLDAWQRGEAQPTLKQLESFAPKKGAWRFERGSRAGVGRAA